MIKNKHLIVNTKIQTPALIMVLALVLVVCWGVRDAGARSSTLSSFMSEKTITAQELWDARVRESRLELCKTVDSLVDDAFLRDELARVFEIIDQRSAETLFVLPNSVHIMHMIRNSLQIMRGETQVQRALAARFSPNTDLFKVVTIACMFSCIGFADIPPSDVFDDYRLHYEKAATLIDKWESSCNVSAALRLSPQDWGMIKDAIQRRPFFRPVPPSETEETYRDPLVGLLTIGMLMDNTRQRLQPWQRVHTFVDLIHIISSHPSVLSHYLNERVQQLQHDGREYTVGYLNGVGKRLVQDVVMDVFTRDRRRIRDFARAAYTAEFETEPSANELDTMMARIQRALSSIDLNSYLWFTSIYLIESCEYDGEKIVIKRHPYANFSPAGNRKHIKNFHIRRFLKELSRVNNYLHSYISIETVDVNNDMYDFVKNLPRGEMHCHMTMSYDFEHLLWDGVLASDAMRAIIHSEANKQKDALIGISDRIYRLYQKQFPGLPRIDCDFLSMLNQLHVSLDYFADVLKEKESLYVVPDRKENLISDIDDLMNSARSGLFAMSDKEVESLKIHRDIYYLLKYTLFELFSHYNQDFESFLSTTDFTKLLPRVVSKSSEDEVVSVVGKALDAQFDDMVLSLELRTTMKYSVVDDDESSTAGVVCVDGEKTKILVDSVAEGYKRWMLDKGFPPGKPRPDCGLILAAKKGTRKNYDIPNRISHMTQHASVVSNLLTEAREKGRNDIVSLVRGFDVCAGEESTPPYIYTPAFVSIGEYNARCAVNERIGRTAHVGESFDDVRAECAIRHVYDAVMLVQLNETENRRAQDGIVFEKYESLNYDAKTEDSLERIGHGLALGLNFDVLNKNMPIGKNKMPVLERIHQIQFDLKLMDEGVPLVACTYQGLVVELKECLELYRRNQKGMVDILPYSKEELCDLRTRSAYVMDVLIAKGVVIEMNPTSNETISPYIETLADHPYRTFKSHRYHQYFKDAYDFDTHSINGFPVQTPRVSVAQFVKSREPSDEKLRCVIGTDDPLVFGVNNSLEYVRLGAGLGLSKHELFELSQNSLQYGFRPLPNDVHIFAQEQYRRAREQLIIEQRVEAKKEAASVVAEEPERISDSEMIRRILRGQSFDAAAYELCISKGLLSALQDPALWIRVQEYLAWEVGASGSPMLKMLQDEIVSEDQLYLLPASSEYAMEKVFNAKSADVLLGLFKGAGEADYSNPVNPEGSGIDAFYDAIECALFRNRKFSDLWEKVYANYTMVEVYDYGSVSNNLRRSFFYVPLTSLAELFTYSLSKEASQFVPPQLRAATEAWVNRYLDPGQRNKFALLRYHKEFFDEMMRRERARYTEHEWESFMWRQQEKVKKRLGSDSVKDHFGLHLESNNAWNTMVALDYYREIILPRYAHDPEFLLTKVAEVTRASRKDIGILQKVEYAVGMKDVVYAVPNRSKPYAVLCGAVYQSHSGRYSLPNEATFDNTLMKIQQKYRSFHEVDPIVMRLVHENRQLFFHEADEGESRVATFISLVLNHRINNVLRDDPYVMNVLRRHMPDLVRTITPDINRAA